MKALLTGATGAIGAAIAAGLLKADCDLTFIARDKEKAEKLLTFLQSISTKVKYILLDLSDKMAIYNLAEKWQGALNILINDAACAPRRKIPTKTGVETMWAVNVLSYYWTMDAFGEKMTKTAENKRARIVNVASYYAGGLNLNDPEYKNTVYNNDSAYRASKQADRMLTKGFADLFKSLEINVYACHPGDVNSRLSNDLGFGGHQSPSQGAATPLYCALSEELEETSGVYLARKIIEDCPYMKNEEQVKVLMDLCSRY